jgi:hypothetical protein
MLIPESWGSVAFAEKCNFQLTKIGKIRFLRTSRFGARFNIIYVNLCEKLAISHVSSVWHVYCSLFYRLLISDEMQPDSLQSINGNVAGK